MNRADPFYCSLFYFTFDLLKKLRRFREIAFAPDLIHKLVGVTVDLVQYKPWQVWVLQYLIYIFIHEFFDLQKKWIIGLKNSVDLWKEFLCFPQKNCLKKFLLIAVIIVE